MVNSTGKCYYICFSQHCAVNSSNIKKGVTSWRNIVVCCMEWIVEFLFQSLDFFRSFILAQQSKELQVSTEMAPFIPVLICVSFYLPITAIRSFSSWKCSSYKMSFLPQKHSQGKKTWTETLPLLKKKDFPQGGGVESKKTLEKLPQEDVCYALCY